MNKHSILVCGGLVEIIYCYRILRILKTENINGIFGYTLNIHWYKKFNIQLINYYYRIKVR